MEIVEGSQCQGFQRCFRAFLSKRTYHDHGTRELLHDALQSLDSIEARHFHVQRDHIWPQGRYFFQGLVSGLSCAEPAKPGSDSIIRVMAVRMKALSSATKTRIGANWHALDSFSSVEGRDQAMYFLHVSFQFEGEAGPVEGLECGTLL